MVGTKAAVALRTRDDERPKLPFARLVAATTTAASLSCLVVSAMVVFAPVGYIAMVSFCVTNYDCQQQQLGFWYHCCHAKILQATKQNFMDSMCIKKLARLM